MLAPASFLTFGKVNAGPLRLTFFLEGGRPLPGVVLDIGEGQLSWTFGREDGRLRLTFFLEGEGVTNFCEGFKSDGVDNRK